MKTDINPGLSNRRAEVCLDTAFSKLSQGAMARDGLTLRPFDRR